MDVSRDPRTTPQPPPELSADVDLAPSVGHVDLHDPAQRHAIEQQLTSVPGILAARIVPGFEREVDELHIVTTPERGAKPTVRDVQTVLLARCSVNIDHRVISVVQVDERQIRPAPGRVKLLRVGTVQSGESLVAEVSLVFEGDQASGSASGAATTSGYVRSVARATLAAFEELSDTDITIELRDATVLFVGGQDLAVTVLELRDRRGEELRSGTAIVREPAGDAVARSVLSALNRSVESASA